jgi:nucleoprotein TPR
VKRSIGDTNGEQAMKEEKDTKIQVNPTINVCHLLCCFSFYHMFTFSTFAQTLEKHLERQREELRKEKERRLKIEKAIRDSYNNVEQVFLLFVVH